MTESVNKYSPPIGLSLLLTLSEREIVSGEGSKSTCKGNVVMHVYERSDITDSELFVFLRHTGLSSSWADRGGGLVSL